MELAEVVFNFFQSLQWSISYLENTTAVSMEYRGRNGRWNCHLHVLEESDQIVFYSLFPAHADDTKRLSAMEFVCRVNSGLILGNFELDLFDGDIRFKTSIDVEGNGLSDALLKPIVFVNLTTMDRYFNSLMALLYQDISVDDALRLAQG